MARFDMSAATMTGTAVSSTVKATMRPRTPQSMPGAAATTSCGGSPSDSRSLASLQRFDNISATRTAASGPKSAPRKSRRPIALASPSAKLASETPSSSEVATQKMNDASESQADTRRSSESAVRRRSLVTASVPSARP